QVLVETAKCAPLPLVRIGGAGWRAAATQPAPAPRFFSTSTVKVWSWPTRLVAVGVMWIRASTNVFTASLPFWPVPSVWMVNAVAPESEIRLEACPVTVPGSGEVNVIAHVPAAPVPPVQVLVETAKCAPLPLA